MRTGTLAIIACIAACAVPTAWAGSKGLNDATFITEASQDGLLEIRAAELALSTSLNGDIQKLAQQIKADHANAAQVLQALATKRNLDAASAPDEKRQKKLDALAARSGDTFDKAYRRETVSAHEDAIKLFVKAQQSRSLSPDLKAFAGDTLPTLRAHLKMARQ